MNILIFGAGAIGSLVGALLSKKHTVTLIGRLPHIQEIKKKGLMIHGKTTFHKKITAHTSIKDIDIKPDLIILTVKSYDTAFAVNKLASIVSNKTEILTFQNGLDNIEKIAKKIPEKNILAGITTHGCIYQKPGYIHHTGIGRSIIGEINGEKTLRIQRLANIFNQVGFPVHISTHIIEEIWKKGIINSSINPLTAIFHCKNGTLLENPILEHIMSLICKESTQVAKSVGYNFEILTMIKETKRVLQETKNNHSSMLQSMLLHKKTEIASINGIIISEGQKYSCDVFLNSLLNRFIQEEKSQQL